MNWKLLISIVAPILSAILTISLTFLKINSSHKATEKSIKAQLKINNDNINANVVSSSRIEWCNSLRNITSEYLSNMTSYRLTLFQVQKQKKRGTISSGENDILEKEKKNFLLSSYQMQLFFPFSIHTEEKNSDIDLIFDTYNDFLENLETEERNDYRDAYLDALYYFLINQESNKNKNRFMRSLLVMYGNMFMSDDLSDEEADKMIDRISIIIPIYLKIEWDIAKKGK